MPGVKVEDLAFTLLIEEARKLEISAKDLVSSIILQYFGAFDEEEEEAEEEEEDLDDEYEE